MQHIITRFENNRERRIRAYNEAKEKVRKLMEQLAEKGLDVTKLSQDLQAWDAMIREFSAAYAAFIEKLKELYECDPQEMEGEISKLLREAREMLMKLRKQALEIRLFYQQTIRADIQELRDQLGGESGAEGGAL